MPVSKPPLYQSYVHDPAQAQQRSEIDALAAMTGGDSRRIDELADKVGHLGGLVKGVDGKLDDLRAALSRMADALTAMIEIKVHQDRAREDIAALRETTAKMGDRLDSLTVRIAEELPPLTKMHTAATRGVYALVGTVACSLLYLVLKHP